MKLRDIEELKKGQRVTNNETGNRGCYKGRVPYPSMKKHKETGVLIEIWGIVWDSFFIVARYNLQEMKHTIELD